jgi:predicted RND superfamily exporter protein
MNKSNFSKSPKGLLAYRWYIIAATILCLGLCVIPLLNVRINSDLESYMPDSMESKRNNKLVNDVFGNNEPLIIIIESDDVLNTSTLKRIDDLSNSFIENASFKQVLSLFQSKNIRSESGMMVVDPVVQSIPETDFEREALRADIKKNDLVYGLVVSENFRYALIMLSTNKTGNDAELMQIVKETIASVPGDEKVYITGQAYLRDEANNKIGRDLVMLLPVGLLMMLLFLWLSFREYKAVLLPFSVVVLSIFISMAMIPLFGWELSLIGILIPIMMIAIANNYGVHFLAKYQELNAKYPKKKMTTIVEESFQYLKKPVILCGITTVVGTLGLVAHLLLPARQMGVVSAIGICFALLLSLTFIPAVLSLLKKEKPHKNLGENPSGFFHHLLKNTAKFVSTKTSTSIVIFVLFFVICTAGIFQIRVAADSNNVLPEKHDFNEAIAIVDGNFGGNKMINIMLTGDARNPELLQRIDRYEHTIAKIEGVGRVASLATLVRKMSTALNDSSDTRFDKIPETREAIAQYLELYSMSADPADFERFLSFTYNETLLTVQYQASSLTKINEIVAQIDEIMRDEPQYVLGGYSLVDKELSESVEKGQYYSLLFAFLAILILLTIIFRSIAAGLLGSLSLVFAVFCCFGLMGWLGIELNIVTALLSSVSIGLGVDFSIHVFWRMKSELQTEADWRNAVKATLLGVGRGITINAFSVIVGFSVLFLSSFPLIQSFAFLIIISLILCLLSALVLIPALCIVIKPKFLLPKNQL